MKTFLIISLWICLFQITKLQQCRQVTVCDEDQASSRRGVKGSIGAPGKAGPVGMKGSKGDIGGTGEKGSQGESCALGSFESEIRQKLSDLEALSTPASCVTSSLYGRQTLRSGNEAFCDNGWTVFLRSISNDVDFTQNWDLYKRGFGSLDGDFWLGLDNIYNLTRDRGCKLRVDVWDSSKDHFFALYSDFSIENESDNYRLHVRGYSGTAGDGLNEYSSIDGIHNGRQFTTKDRDNDRHSSGNCASSKGGWWYSLCADSTLTRPVGMIRWNAAILHSTTMKLRCD